MITAFITFFVGGIIAIWVIALSIMLLIYLATCSMAFILGFCGILVECFMELFDTIKWIYNKLT